MTLATLSYVGLAPRSSSIVDLLRSTRAELLRLRRWPVVWILGGIWILLSLTFSYVFTYITYSSGSATVASDGETPTELLADLLPTGIPEALTAGMPMFGSAIMVVLGALAAGSGYGWGTWKTVYTRGPSRMTATGGTILAAVIIAIGIVLFTVVLDFVVSITLSIIEGQNLVFPAAADLLAAVGSATLMFVTATVFGVAIGVLTRSPAVGIGVSLVWSLVVENLLRGVGASIGAIDAVTKVLPGTASGSLAGAVATTSSSGIPDTPGVLTTLSGGTATLVLAGWLALFVAAALILVSRRDVA